MYQKAFVVVLIHFYDTMCFINVEEVHSTNLVVSNYVCIGCQKTKIMFTLIIHKHNWLGKNW